MDEKDYDALAGNNPRKQKWVVQKLPIKGGNVLRSAMLLDGCKNVPDWVQVEGVIKS